MQDEYIEIKSSLSCITVNTDASFHPEHKVSGYAYYIKHNNFTDSGSGRFRKRNPKDPTQAELMCIGNAISILLNKTHIPTIQFVVINTDCKWAIRQIELRSSELGKEINKLINKLKSKYRCSDIRFRHVKAHSGIEDSRSYVNEWCDREAKIQMRKALSEKLRNI